MSFIIAWIIKANLEHNMSLTVIKTTYKVKYLQRGRNWEKCASSEWYPITVCLASTLASEGIRAKLGEEQNASTWEKLQMFSF